MLDLYTSQAFPLPTQMHIFDLIESQVLEMENRGGERRLMTVGQTQVVLWFKAAPTNICI